MRAVIISNGDMADYAALRQFVRPDDTIIAADGGYRYAEAMGLRPHILHRRAQSNLDHRQSDRHSRGYRGPFVPDPAHRLHRGINPGTCLSPFRRHTLCGAGARGEQCAFRRDSKHQSSLGKTFGYAV